MKKNSVIIIICSVILIFVLGICIYNENKTMNYIDYESDSTNIYDKEGNVIYDTSKINEVTEIIKDTRIQGIVELNHNGFIYIFNGQHFGEFGFEMEEYTRSNIKHNNQICIDYLTLEKYDVNYIQEGDLLMCTGDLLEKSFGDSDFDTKNNAIVVLKSNDYNKMKREALKRTRNYSSVVTIGDDFSESGYLYLKYTLEDDAHSDTGYNFPFVIKAYIKDSTKVIGDLKKGKNVKVIYEDDNKNFDNLILDTIEIIED